MFLNYPQKEVNRNQNMSGEYVKFTYHDGSKKLNAYLKVSGTLRNSSFSKLKDQVNICLFVEHKLERFNLRFYWIDEDDDEIEIVNQFDYEIFAAKSSERQHLHVAAVKQGEQAATKESATAAGAAAGTAGATPPPPPKQNATASQAVVHRGVECDVCGVAPIVGFRYKCIQCPNFDLCQRCEAQHKHVQHMMVRMPNPNCPTVVEAWISGRYGRRGKRSARDSGACPFMTTSAAAAAESATSATADRDVHRHHKHHRRQMRHGIFSHLYDMMQDLAEGGAAAAAEETEEATAATAEARAAAQAAGKAAQAAGMAAQTAAAKAVEATAKMAEAAASQAAHDIAAACATAPANCNPTEPTDNSSAKTARDTSAPNEPHVQASAASSNNTTNVLNSPTLENLAQYIDPQYMKAGIQILNNFSEMFAKILDPADGAASACPFQNDLYATRKDSSDTSASAATDQSKNAEQSNSTEQSAQKQQQQENMPEQQNNVADTTLPAAATVPAAWFIDSAAASSPIENAQTPERRRSNSEYYDWTVIQPPNGNNESFSDSTNSESIESGMNFEQLSKDLKAHVAEEQKREEQAKLEQSIAATSIATETTANTDAAIATTSAGAAATATTLAGAAATATTSAGAAATATTSTTATISAAALLTAPTPTSPTPTPTPPTTPTAAIPKVSDERRAVPVFHADKRINNSVIAMMGMGFSNEGAWLTQLLESVKGDIPAALDLMAAAQRQNQ